MATVILNKITIFNFQLTKYFAPPCIICVFSVINPTVADITISIDALCQIVQTQQNDLGQIKHYSTTVEPSSAVLKGVCACKFRLVGARSLSL